MQPLKRKNKTISSDMDQYPLGIIAEHYKNTIIYNILSKINF